MKQDHPPILTDKAQLLREVLLPIDLEGKRVLDAGAGRMSARALLSKHPSEIVLVTAPGDERKAKPAREQLADFPEVCGQVILGDLADAALFKQDSFDFVLADYLIGEIDCFAPSMQFPVLSNIHRWLRPGGELLIVDIEPLAKGCNSEASPAQKLMFWGQMIHVLARRWDEKPRDYSSELVSFWLDAIGFVDIRVTKIKRELDASWIESTYQAFIGQLGSLDDEGMRKTVRHRLDAAMAAIKKFWASHEGPILQANYSIRARRSAR